jgi:hypothetical protein
MLFPKKQIGGQCPRGWHNRPISDRSAEWTQLISTPHPPIPIKKQYNNCTKYLNYYS